MRSAGVIIVTRAALDGDTGTRSIDGAQQLQTLASHETHGFIRGPSGPVCVGSTDDGSLCV